MDVVHFLTKAEFMALLAAILIFSFESIKLITMIPMHSSSSSEPSESDCMCFCENAKWGIILEFVNELF